MRIESSTGWAEAIYSAEDTIYVEYGLLGQKQGTIERLGHLVDYYPHSEAELAIQLLQIAP